MKLVQLISFQRDEKIKFLDQLDLMNIKKRELQAKGIDITTASPYLDEAQDAFHKGRIDEAHLALEAAILELEKASVENSRMQGLIRFSKNFVVRNRWKIILVFLISVLISIPLVKKINHQITKKKLEKLKLELKNKNEFLSNLQRKFFIEKTITLAAYKLRSVKHGERIASIRSMIPVLEERLGIKNKPLKEEKRLRIN